MEAKDTVVKIEDIQKLWIPCETCHREPFWKTGASPIECMECIGLKHREYQAEISFKAGQEEAIIKHGDYLVAKGRKEVVDFIKDKAVYSTENYIAMQDKLKEWEVS